MKHYKAGNSKIDNCCLISCLPTCVCFGQGKQCKGCYAVKAEKRFKNTVLPSRKNKLKQTKSKNFVAMAITDIVNSKKTVVRIHESGDFYSQKYIDDYVTIIKSLPKVKFYTYTKKALKEDVKNGAVVHYYQPGPFGGTEKQDGTFCVEGPHYPQPHKWYATCTAKNGVIVKVK